MKKILPVLFAFLILLTLPVHAASGRLSAAAAKSGDQVTITVHLDNPGIIATRIFVRYDSDVLQLTGAKNGDVFPQNSAMFGRDLADDPYTVLWDESLRRDNNTNSGTLFTVTFTVKGGTGDGQSSVRFAVDKASTFDVDLNPVTVADCSCSVEVPVVTTKETPSATTTTTKSASSSAIVNTPSGSAAATKAQSSTAPTTKPAVTTTKTITAASGQTTTQTLQNRISSALHAATSSAAESTKEKTTAANAPSTAEQGTTAAQSGETKPIASVPDAVLQTDPASGETVPELLTADGTLLTAAETQTEPQTEPQTPTANHRNLLWLLLLIPAAVAVILVVRKKKA